MKHGQLLVGAAMSLALAACGGGSEGVQSAPTPTPPPSPVDQTMNDLKVSQSFVNDAAVADVMLDKATGKTLASASSRGSLSINYNASTREYSVSYAGRSESFGAPNIQRDGPDQTIYLKELSEGRNRLNLYKNYDNRAQSAQYVSLGFWQYATQQGDRETTRYTAFTYGFPSFPAEIPRVGKMAVFADVFGFMSSPGGEPASFNGKGRFTADFGSGLFAMHSYLSLVGLISGGLTSGTDMELTARGLLSSFDGTFSGTSLVGEANNGSPGIINGRFYGPGATEMGASFSGGGPDGITYVGSMIGVRDLYLTPANLTLTAMTSSQTFQTHQLGNIAGGLTFKDAETFTYLPATAFEYGGDFTSSDKIASDDANFLPYRKTIAGHNGSQDVTLELFRPGSGNSKIALTYTSFGHWSAIIGSNALPTDRYFVYGIQRTPEAQIAARTGSGRYEGVVYGVGSDTISGSRYGVEGTSHFDVDFTANSYSGFLSMAEAPRAGGTAVNFGSFNFAGRLSTAASASGVGLTRDGYLVGQLETRFYGPDAEELGGPFNLTIPGGSVGAGTNISGVTVAKRQ